MLLGIFLVIPTPARSVPELARALFIDGEWEASRLELLREDADPAPDSLHAWMLGIAELSSDQTPAGARRLKRLTQEFGASPILRVAAAFALGLEARSAGRSREAAEYFAQTFLDAPSPEYFAHGGCALYHLLRADRALRRSYSTLWPQLQSASAAWPAGLHAAYRQPRRQGRGIGRLAAWPFAAAVRFYQRQIGPAIGTRCQLYPSCSTFFQQTARHHGWWAVPMYGDRAIREPSIIQAREKVIEHGGRLLVRDPPSSRHLPSPRTPGRRQPSLPDPFRRLVHE